MNASVWLRIGAISGGLAVAAGAFGAHGLENVLEPRMQDVFETAVRYQMYHALGLLAVGVIGLVAGRSRGLDVAGWGFVLGSCLFSGSLYALALTRIRILGAITPFGGLAFLIGWTALALHGAPAKSPLASESEV